MTKDVIAEAKAKMQAKLAAKRDTEKTETPVEAKNATPEKGTALVKARKNNLKEESTDVETRPIVEIRKEALLNAFGDNMSFFRNLLGNEADALKFRDAVIINVDLNPQLLNCTPQSFVTAALQMAQFKLTPNPLEGHAYLIPYKEKVTFQIGSKGYKELAFRTGRVLSFITRVVYEGDKFEQSYDLEFNMQGDKWIVSQYLSHTPSDIKREKIAGAYARAVVRDSVNNLTVKHLYMTYEQIAKYRDTSKSNVFWDKWPEEMHMKTVAKHFAKNDLELSVELNNAIVADGSIKDVIKEDMMLVPDEQFIEMINT